jgi:protein-S-isoprenylcysteine O-methyltransferase Ste14
MKRSALVATIVPLARVLEAHFGDQYRQYKAATWF